MASVNPNDPEDPLAALIKRSMGALGGTADGPGGPLPRQPKDLFGKTQDGDTADPAANDPLQNTEPGPRVEAGAPPPVSTPSLSSDAPVLPSYPFKGKLAPYDEGKFNDPTHMSPKYQVLRVLAGFDPSKGITPDVLAALNKLNLGTFSGSGDKVTLANGDKGWAGMTGADLIQNSGPDGQWAVQGEFPGDASGGSGGAGDMNTGVLALNNPLNTSTQSGVPSDAAFFQQLMDAAQKSMGGNVNRQTLLDMLGLK